MTGQSGQSSENFTQTFNFSPENDEVLTTDEIRKLLNIPETNTLNSYADVHTIGVGGFGAVYAAEEPGLERKLALKILRPRYRQHPERVKAFIREARVTAQIDHPNIVPVHRIGVFEDAGVYFSMKRIAGETLRAILKKLQENRPGYRKKYNLSRLIDIYLGACQGVYYAHQNGVLHCDLKPENLMVGNFGEVLVMDWGMAHYIPQEGNTADTGSDENLKKEDSPVSRLGGTPVFMAPEHLSLSSNEPTVRSDIYAMGCVLYSILTWKSSPFEGNETLEDIQKQVVQGKLLPPRRSAPENQPVPRELEAICLKAMARNPEKRYADMGELIEELRNYRDGLPVDSYSPSPVYKFGKFIFRRPLVPVVFFLSLLVWCGFSLYSFFSDRIYIEYLRTSAVNNFRNGERRLMQAKGRNSQLKRGARDLADMRALETAMASEAADAEADFKAAMDYLVRIPVKYRNRQVFFMLSQKIIKELVGFYMLTRNDKKLLEVIDVFQSKWPEIFASCTKNDPALKKIVEMAFSGKGVVTVSKVSDSVRWSVEDRFGKKVAIESKEKNRKNAEIVFQLPAGYYTVIVDNKRNSLFRIPIRVSLSSGCNVDIGALYDIPEGMVLVPEGEFLHAPEYSNNFNRSSYEKAFLIKRTEVTVGEYLEFWKNIKDPELKKKYVSYYFSTIDSLRASRSWDENGNILRPGLRLTHPVTGISGMAAEAFCRYMSKKLNRKVLLPSRSRWSKAAGGIDGFEYSWGNIYKEGMARVNSGTFVPVGTCPGDSSIYGVLDLTGNVREFVKVSSDDNGQNSRFAVVGGSYFSSPEVAGNSNIAYSSRGGNDVGFRYVMPLEEPLKNPGNKK